jgi:hypothetical protein
MTSRYHHTQIGTSMLAVLPVSAVVCAAAGYLDPPAPGRPLLWGLAIMFVILAVLFSSLTVDVTDDEVRWHFGPGLWRYRVARGDIASARMVRNGWLSGFGVRMRPGFRLYNVSGLDAVELTLRDGEVRRVGTDDPQGLAAALQS